MQNIETKKAMLRLGKLLVSKYKERMISDDTIASGSLKNSFNYNISSLNSPVIKLEILAAKYAKVIDQGRKPGKRAPGIKPLVEWMKAKGIVPYKGTKAKDYKQAAIFIAASIKEKGTISRFQHKGTNFIKEVARQYEGQGVVEILEAYGRDIETQVNKVTKQ
jgi:hypothetical protein